MLKWIIDKLFRREPKRCWKWFIMNYTPMIDTDNNATKVKLVEKLFNAMVTDTRKSRQHFPEVPDNHVVYDSGTYSAYEKHYNNLLRVGFDQIVKSTDWYYIVGTIGILRISRNFKEFQYQYINEADVAYTSSVIKLDVYEKELLCTTMESICCSHYFVNRFRTNVY